MSQWVSDILNAMNEYLHVAKPRDDPYELGRQRYGRAHADVMASLSWQQFGGREQCLGRSIGILDDRLISSSIQTAG